MVNWGDRLMIEAKHSLDTNNFQPVEVEINSVGELVIVFKNVPMKFEQIFDSKKMTYKLQATWE